VRLLIGEANRGNGLSRVGHNRVVMFDNSGVGRTQQLPAPLTIDAMADQTSALIDTLGLGRPNVLGWSMGGMIAQALAVLHPAQVCRLVLCATFPGTGAAVVPSAAARRAGIGVTGHKIARIPVPALIADGLADQLTPVANGFLFQDGTPFASLVESFLTGHPSS
jgi:pimeloyl-ACP methyl ester carboxylesterase